MEEVTQGAPADDAPAGEAPTGEAPVDEAPAGDAPAGDAPVDDAPADDAPVDEAPEKKGRGAPRRVKLVDLDLGRLERGTTGLCVVQWNQKELSHNPNNERNKQRNDNIVVELTDTTRYGVIGPALCVMEEVMGRDSEAALDAITVEMNARLQFRYRRGQEPPGEVQDRAFDYKMSSVVNPMATKRERYAVVYNRLLVGTCEEVANFREVLSQFDPEDRIERHLEIGEARIDLTRAKNIFRGIAENGGALSDRFDRYPALFAFTGPENSPFPKKLYVIAAHSSTGAANRSPHQNMVESIFLQEICHQAAAGGEYCILLGDFNHEEVNNRTGFMWNDSTLYDVAEDGNDTGVNERALFEETRRRFLDRYVRACDQLLPTNVYPFLAGGDATPKHNDDIWLPKVLQADEFVRIDGKNILNPGLFRAGRDSVLFEVPDLGRDRLGRVLEVPARILQQWDTAARDFFIARRIVGRDQLERVARQRLNLMLAKIWSDHRPLRVTLKLTDREQPNRLTPLRDRPSARATQEAVSKAIDEAGQAIARLHIARADVAPQPQKLQ